MLFLIPNQILTNNRPRTFLSSSIASGVGTLSVRGFNLSEWEEDSYVILGEIGTQNAELVQVSANPTDPNELTLVANTVFPHSADEPVYRIDYNQVRIYRAIDEDDTKTLLATVTISPTSFDTRWEDLSNRTGFGFATLYNQSTGGESEFSDAIPYEGLSDSTLTKMISVVRSNLNEKDDDFITDDEIIEAINGRQREVINSHHWTFNEIERSQSTVKNQFDYPIDKEIKTLHTVRINSQPLEYIGRATWERYQFDTDSSAETPSIIAVFNKDMRFYPRPSINAPTTTLTSAITATDSSITTAQNPFRRAGYYRFIIDNEVIYATEFDVENLQFTGCKRGMENTVPSAHNEDSIVTERNIVYSAQASPVDLKEQADETIVPEPSVLTYGASADIANGKLKDVSRGDRMENKFKIALEELKNNFSIKFSSQLMKVKTVEETSRMGLINPNNHPSNIIAP